MSATIGSVEHSVSSAFPTEWAEDWDRVGLLAGDPEREVEGALIALDPTRFAIARAVELGANLLVTHHPAFLSAPAGLSPGPGPGGVLFMALDSGVALLNAHTNLDRSPAAGHLLPSALGLTEIGPIERRTMAMSLITTFVPPGNAQTVIDAMTQAGAGRVGDYERCTFTSAQGSGSFRAAVDASPSVGSPGEQVHVDEVRVEMVAPRHASREVVGAARAVHPYEEPLVVTSDVEIARSAARMGVLCTVGDPATLSVLARLAADRFGVTPRVWGDPAARIERVVTATGSAGSLIDDALASGAQALVAGEVRYHDAVDAVENGLTVIELGHDVSEWPLVGLLADAVRKTPGIDPARVWILPETHAWWTPLKEVE